MKKFLYALLALLCPWSIFLIRDMPGNAMIAFMLQASIFGWIFATVWAFRSAEPFYKQMTRND